MKIRIVKKGRTITTASGPHCACGGLLDYVLGTWWKCRACMRWVER